MNIIKKVFDFKGAPLLLAVFVALFIAERKMPLRKRKLEPTERLITNALVATPSFIFARLMFIPAMVAVARFNQKRRFKLNPEKSKSILWPLLSFLLLDYSTYLWHKLNHKIPLLWRFHVVHHTDLDLDLSTAIRFHFGEMIGSVIFRGFFVWLSGASPLNVLIYEIIFEAETQFHHSNLNINPRIEKVLDLILVTPRMHGIHHSNMQIHTDSNYAVIFSFWDRIFGTSDFTSKQENTTIGAPSFTNTIDFNVKELLIMPFLKT